MSYAPLNWVFSLFSFIGFVLCCIPFPWHLAAWNTGTCLYMAWTGVTCLVLFINSVVWNGNVINWAPVWCDISARLYIGIDFALPATCLCIARRLYGIAAVRNAVITRADKRRAVIIDLAIGVGIPVLGMILQYIPQGHRFNIIEDVGCFPFTYNTPVGLALVSIPPILIGAVCAIYAVLGVISFNRSRKQFNELLSGSHLTNHRYIRLMCLSALGSFSTLTFGIYVLARNCSLGMINPWLGWADTHFHFSRVDQIPSLLWRSDPGVEASIELTRWLTVFSAFVFFGFFGFAEEARKNYQSVAQSLVKHIPALPTSPFSSSFFSSSGSKAGLMSIDGGATIPVFIQSHIIRTVDDLDSISNMSVIDASGVLTHEKEKIFSPDVPYDAVSFSDVGGTLSDSKTRPCSPSPSLTSTLAPAAPPGLPHRPCTWRIGSVMDISPMRSGAPRPVLDANSAPRHSTDTPIGVHSVRNTHDILRNTHSIV